VLELFTDVKYNLLVGWMTAGKRKGADLSPEAQRLRLNLYESEY
jgi:hypothetical protein